MSDVRYISAGLQGLSLSGEKKYDGDGENEFAGYAVIWDGETDYNGFTVARGALDESLAKWANADEPLPLLYNHNSDDPAYNIGEVIEWVADERGLKVRCRVDVESGEVAKQVWRLLKSRRVKEMSFFGVILDSTTGARGEEHLTKIDIKEVSVVFMGANKRALVEYVKNSVEVLQRLNDVEALQALRDVVDEGAPKTEIATDEDAETQETDTTDTLGETGNTRGANDASRVMRAHIENIVKRYA